MDQDGRDEHDELDRILESVMNDPRSEPADVPDEVVFAYVNGTATAEERAIVLEALASSKAFRAHVLAMTEELARVESPAFAAAFRAADVDDPPTYRGFRVQRWLSRRMPWARGALAGSAMRSPGVRALAAAVLVTAILGYPAFRGLVELPNVLKRESAKDAELAGVRAADEAKAREVASLRNDLEQARKGGLDTMRSIAADTVVLAPDLGVTRGQPAGGAISRVAPRAGSVLYVFQFAPEPPEGLPAGRHLMLQFCNAAGDVKGTLEFTAKELSTALSETGVVAMAVPAADAPAGRYRVLLTSPDTAGAPPLWKAEFDVVRP
jgi:hypothetical protein